MDLQKEREEFEAWHYEQYLLENPNIAIANAKYIYDYAHNNALVYQLRESHFIAWQAAKARAIPDGFVVVPKEPTQKMLNAGHVVMNPIKGSLVQAGTNQKRRDCYKAMIEAAQEAMR